MVRTQSLVSAALRSLSVGQKTIPYATDQQPPSAVPSEAAVAGWAAPGTLPGSAVSSSLSEAVAKPYAPLLSRPSSRKPAAGAQDGPGRGGWDGTCVNGSRPGDDPTAQLH